MSHQELVYDLNKTVTGQGSLGIGDESEKARAKRDKAQANKKNQQFGKLRFMMKRKNKD